MPVHPSESNLDFFHLTTSIHTRLSLRSSLHPNHKHSMLSTITTTSVAALSVPARLGLRTFALRLLHTATVNDPAAPAAAAAATAPTNGGSYASFAEYREKVTAEKKATLELAAVRRAYPRSLHTKLEIKQAHDRGEEWAD